MPSSRIHRCGCAKCRAHRPHADRPLHRQVNLFLSRLDEQQRRWFVALEGLRVGSGGEQRLAEITGMSPHTIRRGREELSAGLADCSRERIRAPGGGRPVREDQDPALALDALLVEETAGDPMGRHAKATRRSLRHLSAMLTAAGHAVSRPTVSRLLRERGYSPKRNARRTEARRSPPPGSPSSAWTRKKKELVGDFYNAGQRWCTQADAVLVHAWPQDAIGQAIPYGIYEVSTNRGFVCVGDCFDTPRFAVEAIRDWWQLEGCHQYPRATRLLILADAGGSNSCRSRVWKAQLQEQLADAGALEITVCHYPTGYSKWNPIEHRLFSQISLNWASVPLRTFETIMRYITGTVTAAGLHVTGYLKRGGNETGERVSNEEMRRLSLTPHEVCPAWNYTLNPRPA